ncbi:Phospholipase D1 [Coemansia sp. Benny D115]|nr:Phospholipase D1 [Coemansia sp. Benny D115]
MVNLSLRSALICAVAVISGTLQPEHKFGALAKGACAAQNILTNCLSIQGQMFSMCAYSDWTCKCQAQKSLASCYGNCPDDQGRSAAEGQIAVYCNAVLREEEAKSAKETSKSSSLKMSKKSDSDDPSATGKPSTMGVDDDAEAKPTGKPGRRVPKQQSAKGASKGRKPAADGAAGSLDSSAAAGLNRLGADWTGILLLAAGSATAATLMI